MGSLSKSYHHMKDLTDRIEAVIDENGDEEDDTLERVALLLTERVEELEEEVEQLEEQLEERDKRLEAISNGVSNLREERWEMQEKIEAMSEHRAVGGVSVDVMAQLSRGEQIVLDLREEPDTVTEQRAVELLRRWDSMKRRMGDMHGVHVENDNLLSALESFRGEELNHAQLGRAMKSVEELTDGKVQFVRSERGRRLVEREDETVVLTKKRLDEVEERS